MTDQNDVQGTQAQEQEQQFIIQRIYIKDVSFESPHAPLIYADEWKPETNLQLNTQSQPVSDNIHEVELQLTITVKSKEKVAFLIEVTQAGLFEVMGYTPDETNYVLATHCPTILFPYAREAIAGLVSKGSFPELHLSPINFEALYAQRLAESQQQKKTNAEDKEEEQS